MQRHTAATENLGRQRKTTTPASPLRLPVPITLFLLCCLRLPPPRRPLPLATGAAILPDPLPGADAAPTTPPLRSARLLARSCPAAPRDLLPACRRLRPSPWGISSPARATAPPSLCSATATAVRLVQAGLNSFVASTSSFCLPPL